MNAAIPARRAVVDALRRRARALRVGDELSVAGDIDVVAVFERGEIGQGRAIVRSAPRAARLVGGALLTLLGEKRVEVERDVRLLGVESQVGAVPDGELLLPRWRPLGDDVLEDIDRRPPRTDRDGSAEALDQGP